MEKMRVKADGMVVAVLPHRDAGTDLATIRVLQGMEVLQFGCRRATAEGWMRGDEVVVEGYVSLYHAPSGKVRLQAWAVDVQLKNGAPHVASS